jgi:ribosomal protein L11 methylase PrmA
MILEKNLQRRVAGPHDIRMDGMTDLVCRARGASVFDIGCNRGLVGFEFANNGAALVHGCDNYAGGIDTARQLFCDLRAVQSKFETVDLTEGVEAVKAAFGDCKYDIVLCLATAHKLNRVMPEGKLSELMQHFGKRAIKYFGWRATSGISDEQISENRREMKRLDVDMKAAGLDRIHTSMISESLGLCAIWSRP